MRSFSLTQRHLILLALLPFAWTPCQESTKPSGPEKWEKEVAAYEAQDKKQPPAKGAILFSGSSSIRQWKVEKNFPDLTTINRGIGGSIISDNTHFAERLIFPHEPSMIVFYAGDNDLAQNRTPEQVAVDFKAYVAKVRTKLPETPILFLAIKPSIARWKIYEKQQKANAAVREYCSQSPSLRFVDIVPATLGPDGQPNKEFFLKDGLHLNEAGYAAWAKVLSGEIAKAKR